VGSNGVIFGNGGAPLTGSNVDFGYGLVRQLSNGTLQIDSYDYQTNQPDPSFVFFLNPDGTPVQ
jgi:hypothetical protein